MYTNIKGLRIHEVKVRFNEEEDKLINHICDYHGVQKAAFVREMALEHIKEFLAQEDDSRQIQS
jgi:pimeloyl-CoA synthetase